MRVAKFHEAVHREIVTWETVPGEQGVADSSTTDASPPLELIATAAAGTEAVVKRELAALGYAARTVTPGRLLFPGDANRDLPRQPLASHGRARC